MKARFGAVAICVLTAAVVFQSAVFSKRSHTKPSMEDHLGDDVSAQKKMIKKHSSQATANLNEDLARRNRSMGTGSSFDQAALDSIFAKVSEGNYNEGFFNGMLIQNCAGLYLYLKDGEALGTTNFTKPPTEEECKAFDPDKAFKIGDFFKNWDTKPTSDDEYCKDVNPKLEGKGIQHYKNKQMMKMLIPLQKAIDDGSTYTCKEEGMRRGGCSAGVKLTADMVLVKGSSKTAEWLHQSIEKKFQKAYLDCAEDDVKTKFGALRPAGGEPTAAPSEAADDKSCAFQTTAQLSLLTMLFVSQTLGALQRY